MDTLQHLMTGLAAAMSLQNLAFALIGCTLGTLIGVLPGLGPRPARPSSSRSRSSSTRPARIIMLSAIYYGAMYGGTITSVLINVPGEAASVVTCFDGHADGQAGPRRHGSRHRRHRLFHRRYFRHPGADRGRAAACPLRIELRSAGVLRPHAGRPVPGHRPGRAISARRH